jgi:hypothetical protein
MAAITALAIAGCGSEKNKGDGVATAGGTPTATSTNADAGAKEGDQAGQMRKFAQCMRDHGVNMPDPEIDSEGRVGIQFGGGDAPDTPENREKFEAAQKECQQYLPNGGEPPKLDPADVEKLRQFSKCMRENGVPDFPDPADDGSLRIQFDNRNGGTDPNSQAFKDAQAKCQQYMPRPPGSGGGQK